MFKQLALVFSFFFPAPPYTRVCIMRGPVYRNAFFFFSSLNGSGDDRKRKYRELCRQSAAVVILHCPPSNCTIRASRKPVSRVSRDRAPRPPPTDLSKVHRYVYTSSCHLRDAARRIVSGIG